MFETSALIKYDQDTLLALWCANKGKRRSNFNIFQISNNPISNNYERCCKYAILKNIIPSVQPLNSIFATPTNINTCGNAVKANTIYK
mmetsp:Transcript_26432/g.55457  ORF Transcript_26432/g.55457 Transcript_26432/m.55457 type:complete len:88 (-) Transcript_26432:187-450(-)